MKKLVLCATILATISPALMEAGPRKPLANKKPIASAANARADAAVLNSAFRDVAKALASALKDPVSRRLIKDAAGKKFDGDVEVLYRDIANRRVGSGRVFRQVLGQSMAKVHGRLDKASVLTDLDQFTSSLPTLQIAVPAGFVQWDPESEAPLVTFVPVGVDDDEILEVEAFDAEGRSYMLDARMEPTVPVVVVGLNERTDENGYLLSNLQVTDKMMALDDPYQDPYYGDDPGDNTYEPVEPVVNPTPTLGVCDARTHNDGDKEILYQIKINDDHEPWVKGSPEIYATYSFVDNQGIKGQYHMGNVDNTGQWYTINGHLFYWQGYYGNTLAMAIWEKDGTNYGSFSYSFFGATFTVAIQDDDDQLGANPVSFFDPVCGYYSTGDAEYKMRYQAP